MPEGILESVHVSTSKSTKVDQALPVTQEPSEKSTVITTQTSQIPRPGRPFRRNNRPPISLSEILQSIGISLPQFLVQLKLEGTNLKQFTTKLDKRSLTRVELKQAHGNVGELLKMLNEVETSITPSVTPAISSFTTTRPTFRRITFGVTKKNTDDSPSKVSLVTTYRSTTLAASDTSSIKQSTTESTSPATEKANPKIFGFRPSSTIKKNGAIDVPANIAMTNSSDVSSTPTSESKSLVSSTLKSIDDESKEGKSYNEDFIYRPYKPAGGGWRDRMQHNRGVVSRLGTTTRRPTVRPNYSYNGGNSDLMDLINKQNDDSEKEMIKIDVVALETSPDVIKNKNSLFNIGVIGLTEGTPMGGRYDHPRYDRDPNSLNIATRSAIMAAGVLGGVALAVFISILVFVMYRNHVSRRRRHLRIPFPLSVASDDSSTSTPPLYSTRSRSGLGMRSSSQTDFWGTLKRKFDPYSISSTSASYY